MATIRKVTVRIATSVWSLHTRIEAEHVIMAGAYAGTGVIGHDSPALMALAYFVVGTTHVVACRKTPSGE